MSSLSEIIFEVSEDEVDGGYSASALEFGIHTEGETIDEVRRNVREAVECYFDEGEALSGSVAVTPRGGRTTERRGPGCESR